MGIESSNGQFRWEVRPQRRENVIALGPSGTGKTHVALELGLAACQKGLSVGFTTAAALVHELMEARDERRLLRLQKQMAGPEMARSAAEGPHSGRMAAFQARLVADLTADRYECIRHSNTSGRYNLAKSWARRRGQMIR